jgi:hypothetical protein
MSSKASSTIGTPHCFVQHRHDGKDNYTKDEPKSWMSVDLGEGRSLAPDHYCLRHVYNDHGMFPQNFHAMRNWQLEGSNDGIHWDTLRSHANDTALDNDCVSEAAWPVHQDTNTAYRHFRILQTGGNSAGNNLLICTGIELYGTLQLQ